MKLKHPKIFRIPKSTRPVIPRFKPTPLKNNVFGLKMPKTNYAQDTDRDGFPDHMDCQPKNPLKQGERWDRFKEKVSSTVSGIKQDYQDRKRYRKMGEESAYTDDPEVVKGNEEWYGQEPAYRKAKIKATEKRRVLEQTPIERTQEKNALQMSKLKVREQRGKVDIQRANVFATRQKAMGSFGGMQGGMGGNNFVGGMQGGMGGNNFVGNTLKGGANPFKNPPSLFNPLPSDQSLSNPAPPKKKIKKKKGKKKKGKTITINLG